MVQTISTNILSLTGHLIMPLLFKNSHEFTKIKYSDLCDYPLRLCG